MNNLIARRKIIYIMQKYKIEILALLEMNVNFAGKEMHDNYIFYFSRLLDDDE